MANKKLASKKKKSRNKSSTRANPLSAQEGSSSSAETAAAYVASPSLANTTAAPAPAQRLYARCPLKEYFEELLSMGWGAVQAWGSLAGKVAHLGSKGITHGRLTGENIFVIGNGAENLEVEIRGIPHKYNPAMPSYREQFQTLASEVVDTWEAPCPMVSKHFFEMLEQCIPWFYFKQLQWHPLLLSSHEVAVVIFRLYTHLDVGKKGWKNNYKKLITRENVDFDKIISGTGRGAFAFSKVYSYPSDQKEKALQLSEKEKKNSYSPVEYEPNALGALEFFRHALSHVNDHMWDDFVEKNAVYT
ncbi:hypothetical protein PRUPE_2G063000 [Prunus persica]|uniref:Uncharacterized protein n=1 Tax=Prunus persica TaxID=3760 RepID=A0A251QC51_PRUPE|nr:hypothetical protein PRUPE_2G063000 [Prunus persica]